MILSPKPKIYVYSGRPAVGKSFLMRGMVYTGVKKGIWKFGVVYSPSGKYNDDWRHVMPKDAIRDYNEKNLQSHIQSLRDWREENDGEPVDHNLIILDDCLGLIAQSSSFFVNFLSTHRHTSTSIFISAQYLVRGTSPTLRELANYAFMWASDSKRNKTALYESFGQRFDTEADFLQALEKATSVPYQCLKYDQSKSGLEAYSAFIGMAKVPDFKWKFSLKEQESDEDEPEVKHKVTVEHKVVDKSGDKSGDKEPCDECSGPAVDPKPKPRKRPTHSSLE
jgi:hypothetical protein